MSEIYTPPFGIKRIKEFSFLVNESLFELNKPVTVQFQHHTKFGIEENSIDLTLRVYYSYEAKIPPDNVLVDFHVQNIFEVQDLKQYKEKDSENYFLPESLISSLVGIAISHTRSLMAHNVAGTLYQDNIIPIVDPLKVAKAFYPNMFIKTDEGLKSVNKPTHLNVNESVKRTSGKGLKKISKKPKRR